jgi:hypothetical protein
MTTANAVDRKFAIRRPPEHLTSPRKRLAPRQFRRPLPAAGQTAALNDNAPQHPYVLGMSEQALRIAPAVVVECLSCRHVGVLTGEALTRRAVGPNTPIAAFVKRLRCSKCGSQSVLATRRPSQGSKRIF